jgi:glycosyltransferase involved in cell wall biosynthesis
VLFTHNVESWIFERHAQVATNPLSRLLWSQQHRKMQSYERQTLERFDAIVAVSEKDAAYFRDEFGRSNVHTIPTGVDLDYFAWSPPGDRPQVVFTGSMDWPANHEGIEFFLNHVWPKVVAQVPQATMKVIGRRPSPALVAKAPANWQFTGFVDDIRPHARGSAVSVIPLRVGGGTRIKAYEAMAMGLPVVSTSIGVEGLPVEAERHYVCADDAESFAQAVIRVLRDRTLANELSRQARDFVESKYSNREVAKVFEGICSVVAREGAAR